MTRLKTSLLTIAVLLCSLASSAHDFEVDGIYYNITSDSDLTASVTFQGDSYNSYFNEYSGDVVIPEKVTYNDNEFSVTSIGISAFDGCSNLTSVTIPNSVTSIGDDAFIGCFSLASIDIPNSVTSIGDDAFIGCFSLASIDIPNSVTNIGRRVFSGCSGLMSVNIGNSVTSIAFSAFEGCTGLSGVTIPNSVTSIEGSAFSGCSGLTSITIGSSVTSIAFSAFEGCTGLSDVTIPNSVTSIGYEAFRNCSGLTSVTIPKSVTSIDGNAFSGCSGLTSIKVESGNTNYDSRDNCNAIIETNTNTLITGCKNTAIPNFVTSIGGGAFSGCSALSNVIIPNSVTSIGHGAFFDCSGLTSVDIPNSVASIGSRAFQGCSGLTSVTIPKSVTSIDGNAFSGCSGLTSIKVESGNTKYDSRDNCNAIIETNTNTLIAGCVNTVIPNSVTSIGNDAFHGCSGLTSMTIPNSVTSIGHGAFFDCSGLTSVDIPNSVASIGSDAFQGCSGLTSVTIPNSVTNIGSRAFCDCSGLTSVTIPNSVTSIGSDAFEGCSSLTSVVIPNSVTSIGSDAFEGCSSLTSVVIPNSVTSIGYSAFSGCSGLTSVTIPNSVTSIGSSAFYGCSGLTSVVIPNSVTSIGSDAFEGCSSLTEVTIGNSVTSIGSHAFSGCSGLTSVTIPNSVTSIGSRAFYNCSSLTEVTIGNSVTSIEDYTFYGCSGLTSIDIPNSVTSIGVRAFEGCSGLTEVTIGNSVTIIGVHAFTCCSGLTSVTIPNSVTTIEDYAFYGCSGLTSIDISNTVTEIGTRAFVGCYAIKEVHITDLSAWCNVRFSDYMSNPTYRARHLYLNDEEIINLVIPEDVTSIGNFAFYECFAMKSVTVPNSVTSIGSSTFEGCSGLTSVTIPNSVTSIGGDAFRDCSGLTGIDIPNSVTSIGDGTFAGCMGIKEVRCMASQPPAISEFSFSKKSYDRALLVVPDNSSNLYKNAEHWKNFKNVNFYIKADSITLDKKSATMSEGETIMLSAILHPKKVIDQNIVWSSSDESVATVEDGNVTALRTGKTVITAKIEKVDTIISVPSTIVISNGTDIYEWSQSADIQTLLKTPTTETLVFDLEAGGHYTLSNVVDFGHNKIILRTASKSNWATIVYGNDASIRFGGGFILSNINIDGNETIAPILGLSDNPNEDILGLNSHYIINDPVTIQNCNFYNVQRHFLHDNKRKYCVATFLMENVMVNFTTDTGMSSASYFQIYEGGGFINDFTLRSCTFWNSANKDGAVHDAKYFIRYNNSGRCDRAGFTKNSINMYNCTFYNIAKTGQMANHGGFDGRKTSAYEILNNIFVNCGSNQVARRIVGRVGNVDATIFENNTYRFDGVAESGNTSYDSGYQLQSDPAFVDTVNANFTPTGAEQLEKKTGDPRWLINSAESVICEITVKAKEIVATGITLNKTTAEMFKGDTLALTASISPEDATDKTVTWTSSDETVAIVKDGIVTALKAGKVTITASTPGVQIRTNDCVINDYPVYNETYDLSNAITFKRTTWPQFDVYVLDKLNLTKEQFDAQYKLDVTTDPAIPLVNGGLQYRANVYSDTKGTLATYTCPTTKNKVEFGSVLYYEDESSTTNQTFEWTLTSDELEYLVSDADTLPVNLKQYVRYVGNSKADYDYIYIKLEANISKISSGESTTQLKSNKSRVASLRKTVQQTDSIVATCEIVVRERYDAQFSIPDTLAYPSKQFSLPVEMSNTAELTAFQCDVYIPEGLTLQTDDKGRYDITLSSERCDDHTLSALLQSDGSIRIAMYSMSTSPILGTEGPLFTLNMSAGEELSAYEVQIKNIYASDASGKLYSMADVTGTVTVDYRAGDANGDGIVAVNDVVYTVNKILNNAAEDFIFIAADMNDDNEIMINDVVMIVNTILGTSTTTAALAPRHMNAYETLSVADSRTAYGMTEFGIALSNASRYTAMQFDMEIAEGAGITDIKVSMPTDHSVAYRRIDDTTVRVVVTSLTNEALAEGAQLCISMKDAAGKTVAFTNGRAACNNGQMVGIMPGSTVLGGATGIDGVNAEFAPADVYSIDGRIVKKNATTLDGLKPGVYVVNGRKVVVEK